ncbi:MAG: hypothetical protein AAF481_02010 [Acidobacteriota bacterium]
MNGWRWFALLLCGAAILFTVGINWGLPSWNGWAADELHPRSWERAVTPETHAGWHARYPPLHFTILNTLAKPVRWAMSEEGPIPKDSWHQNLWLTMAARVLSVLMALSTLVVLFFIGNYLVAGRIRPPTTTGLFAALIMALTAPYVYYAKMANLESPYLLWFACSLLFYLRLLNRPRLRDAIFFGLAAAATVATKDQAYALYALAPMPVLLSLARQQDANSIFSRLARATVDRRFMAAGISAAFGYAVFQNLIFNWVRFSHHVDLLLGPMSSPYREYGHGVTDQLLLAKAFVQQTVFALNPLLFIICVIGILWTLRRARRTTERGTTRRCQGLGARREARLLGGALVLAVSYYITLIAVIGFTFDRYVLPVTLILSLAGARCFALWLERSQHQKASRTLSAASMIVVLGVSLLYAASVDTRMVADGRYAIEDWVSSRAPRAEVLAIGRTKHVPRFQRLPWSKIYRTDGGILDRARPRFVAINITDLRAPRERAFVERMDRGELGYVRALTHQGRPLFNLLYFGDLYFGDVGTSQRFVNPEIAVWERLP